MKPMFLMLYRQVQLTFNYLDRLLVGVVWMQVLKDGKTLLWYYTMEHSN
ncbi:hypothetical protein ES705_18524 [subsurface metagenome]